jgi:hypothetical protein
MQSSCSTYTQSRASRHPVNNKNIDRFQVALVTPTPTVNQHTTKGQNRCPRGLQVETKTHCKRSNIIRQQPLDKCLIPRTHNTQHSSQMFVQNAIRYLYSNTLNKRQHQQHFTLYIVILFQNSPIVLHIMNIVLVIPRSTTMIQRFILRLGLFGGGLRRQ